MPFLINNEMKRNLLILSVLVLCLCADFPKVKKQTNKTTNQSRPNIIIIMADDMGFSDIG